VLAALGSFWPSAASAEDVVREVSWAEAEQSGQREGVERITPSGPGAPPEALKIENHQPQAKTVRLLTLPEPGVGKLVYAIQGVVRCEDVAAGSYLEMWSHFSDGGAYFTRTLASSGPMRALAGSSDWRPLLLPFFSSKGLGVPSRLEINLVLAGSGTVYLGPLRLVEYGPGEDPLGQPGQWWSERAGGWIGGIGGSLLGCLGGLIGTLAGAGKARRLVLALVRAVLAFGVVCLVAAGVALVSRQPYAVWYPLALGGGISTLVMGGLLPGLRRRYEEIELRKMAAMDVAGGPSSAHPSGPTQRI
jgi:hypothetical protein